MNWGVGLLTRTKHHRYRLLCARSLKPTYTRLEENVEPFSIFV
ncbi:hypothetical protein [Trichodesmium erythraeum]